LNMSSLIRIKKRSRLPWNTNLSSNSSFTNQNTISKDTSSRSSNNNHLRTSDFSKLSKISAMTPPSYSVYENSEGEMINEKENVKWPERPLTGYHSLKEYKKRKAFIRKNIRDQEKYGKNKDKDHSSSTSALDLKQNEGSETSKKFQASCVTTGKCANMGFCNMPNINANEENSGKIDYINGSNVKQSYLFCGVKTPQEIKSFAKSRDIFYLFYDSKRTDDKIQFEIPLKMAYFDAEINDYVIKNVYKKFSERMVKVPIIL
uniref:DIX domain-containing protein n=2 Tax=Strongyloides papillosus TaxID=174720 RepID=A0A0N5CGV7_STREA